MKQKGWNILRKDLKWENVRGSIFKEEWDLLKEIIKKYNIKTVLEFGCGQTTKLFHSLNLDYLSLEEKQEYIAKRFKGFNVQHWNKRKKSFDKKFDLSFIDGPEGSENREISFIIAKDISKFIIVHDATNEWNIEWQRKHLNGKFELIDFIKTLFVWRRK